MSALENALADAHRSACHRDNISTVILKESWRGNGGDLMKSITSAMMSLGGIHAPIKQTYRMIEEMIHPSYKTYEYKIIPGFGSGFIKGEPDPILKYLHEELEKVDNRYIKISHYIRETFLSEGKDLYPNIAFYTAAVAHYLEEDIKFCERFVLETRIPEWINILKDAEEKEIS